MPASPLPFRTADSRVSLSTVMGPAELERFMPPVVIFMMPWLFPRSWAYIITCTQAAADSLAWHIRSWHPQPSETSWNCRVATKDTQTVNQSRGQSNNLVLVWSGLACGGVLGHTASCQWRDKQAQRPKPAHNRSYSSSKRCGDSFYRIEPAVRTSVRTLASSLVYPRPCRDAIHSPSSS